MPQHGEAGHFAYAEEMPLPPASTALVSPLDGDEPAFAAKTDAVIRGVISDVLPARVFVVRIDNWFGGRWLGFVGKGSRGIYGWHTKESLRIPPFVPTRVVSESLWLHQADHGTYAQAPAMPSLHKVQRSEKNFDRWVSRLLPDAALFWISGDSVSSGRGAILAHVPTEEGHVAWYAGLVHDNGWHYGERIDISREMLDYFERIGSEDAATARE